MARTRTTHESKQTPPKARGGRARVERALHLSLLQLDAHLEKPPALQRVEIDFERTSARMTARLRKR